MRKRCDCAKWKTCEHPWYLDYQRGKDHRCKPVRYRDNLDKLIDRHCSDFASAKDEARRAITAKLEGRDPRGLVPTDEPTVADLLAAFTAEKPRNNRWQVGRINATNVPTPDGLRAFGNVRAHIVTPDTLKAFRLQRPLVAGNRDLALLRATFNWAVLRGFLPRSPFRIGDVPAVRLAREEARTRRLQAGEDARLLDAAGSLRGLILAAVETGCRVGELLSLQWHQVRFSPRAEIFLPAQKTKAKRDRRVPISTELRKVLDARRSDPAGEFIPADGYVFGDEIGRQRHSVKTAWRLTCQRANLTDLHFHDLRREAGSRWMDAGIPLATIQRWLGHANIAQTSTYLGASHGADELDMRMFEERIGRIALVTHSDAKCGTKGSEPTSTDTAANEIAQQNAIKQGPTDVVH
ncbi:MAG TPA: site-specific integrase [Vicinamibacterales bacterium]|nr:site-specific integrase [Vicinamibacterales bacterium]